MFDRRQFNAGLLIAAGLGLCGRPAAAATAEPAGAFTATLVTDLATGGTLLREGPCDRRFYPCSSFKFPLAIMGFDAGILRDPQTPRWDYRPEYKGYANQQKTTDPTVWLGESIVWFSQQLTLKLGMPKFQAYVDRFAYGNRDLSGNPGKGDGLTQSWLMSSLRVSPDEQVRLVTRFLKRDLGVAKPVYEMTTASMPVFAGSGGWTVRGKTGSGWHGSAPQRFDRNRPLGWFVGWAEKEGRTLAFARYEVGAGRAETPGGMKARKAVLDLLGQF